MYTSQDILLLLLYCQRTVINWVIRSWGESSSFLVVKGPEHKTKTTEDDVYEYRWEGKIVIRKTIRQRTVLLVSRCEHLLQVSYWEMETIKLSILNELAPREVTVLKSYEMNG